MNPISLTMLRSWVIGRYALHPLRDITLLRSCTNAVFVLTTAREPLILKIYGLGWRTLAEISYEVDLLNHLAAKGVPVAPALPGLDQQSVQRFPTPAGTRLAVLFAYAPGAKPEPPFAPSLYEQVGRATAALHQAANDFVTPHQRRPLDTTYLLDEPLALIDPLLTGADARHAFRRFVAHLREAIQALAERGLDWGPVHGDLTLDNLHVTTDHQIVWYDFDSGGPGWRAGDLQGWAAFQPDAAPKWGAFLRGYQSVRPLAPINIEAAPYIQIAFAIWGMTVDLRYRILSQGQAAVQHYLSESLTKLAPWADYFGFAL